MNKNFIEITDFRGGEVRKGGPTEQDKAKPINPNLTSKNSFSLLENIVYVNGNIIRKRKGYEKIDDTLRAVSPGHIGAFITIRRAHDKIYDIYDVNNIVYASLNGAAPTIIGYARLTGFYYDSTSGTLFMSDVNGVMYKWLYGENKGALTVENSIRTIEIIAPATAPTATYTAGGNVTGEYRYKYTYVLNTGTESELSTAYLETAAITGVNVNVTILNPDNGYVIYAWLYRTKDLTGKSTAQRAEEPYYFVKEGTMAGPGGADVTIIDDLIDADLIDEATVFGYETPLPITAGVFAQNRLILVGNNKIWVSDVGKPDSMRAALQYTVTINDTEGLRAVFEIGAYIYATCKNGNMQRITATGSLTTPYTIRPVEEGQTRGSSSSSVAVMNGKAYMVNGAKIWAFNGMQFMDISGAEREACDYMKDVLYNALEEKTQLYADPVNKAIHIFIKSATDYEKTVIHLVFWPDVMAFTSWAGYIDEGATAKQKTLMPRGMSYDAYHNCLRIIDNQAVTHKYDNAGTFIDTLDGYNVKSIIEQRLNFKGRTFINALIAYTQKTIGQDIDISVSADGDAYAAATVLNATIAGGTEPINMPLQNFKYKIEHEDAEDFLIDYWEIMAPKGYALALKDDIGE